MTQGIYEIVNLCDGKATAYVGSSQDIAQRWSHHRSILRNGQHINSYLQSAWDKYGADAFEWNVIEEVESTDALLVVEQRYLNAYFASGHCYNIARCAEAPTRGLKHTDETRQNMSKAQMGKTLSDETRQKISKANKGKQNSLGYKHTDEAKCKISKALMGRSLSDETCQKMSDAARNRKPISEETRARMSKAQIGKTRSDETKARMSEIQKGNQKCLGYKHTAEARARMSKAAKQREAKLRTLKGAP